MKKFATNLYRGPRPTTAKDVTDLFSTGIRTVINLQEAEDYDDVVSEYLRHEMGCIDIEQVAIFPPPKRHVDLVLQALCDPKLYPIYMHCQAGVDRDWIHGGKIPNTNSSAP